MTPRRQPRRPPQGDLQLADDRVGLADIDVGWRQPTVRPRARPRSRSPRSHRQESARRRLRPDRALHRWCRPPRARAIGARIRPGPSGRRTPHRAPSPRRPPPDSRPCRPGIRSSTGRRSPSHRDAAAARSARTRSTFADPTTVIRGLGDRRIDPGGSDGFDDLKRGADRQPLGEGLYVVPGRRRMLLARSDTQRRR